MKFDVFKGSLRIKESCTLSEASEITLLDQNDILASIESDGCCDTDTHTILPTATQESIDLRTLKEDTWKIKQDTFDLCVMYLTMDLKGLASCGHKDNKSAVFESIKMGNNQIKRLTAEHIKKYPD